LLASRGATDSGTNQKANREGRAASKDKRATLYNQIDHGQDVVVARFVVDPSERPLAPDTTIRYELSFEGYQTGPPPGGTGIGGQTTGSKRAGSEPVDGEARTTGRVGRQLQNRVDEVWRVA
jgi:hypothetical protein